jgi:hypothetical protein
VNDTPERVAARYRELLMQRSSAERVARGSGAGAGHGADRFVGAPRDNRPVDTRRRADNDRGARSPPRTRPQPDVAGGVAPEAIGPPGGQLAKKMAAAEAASQGPGN